MDHPIDKITTIEDRREVESCLGILTPLELEFISVYRAMRSRPDKGDHSVIEIQLTPGKTEGSIQVTTGKLFIKRGGDVF